ncbi:MULTISPECIES: beta-ketoacyl-[acyl-carrier-protein] synthase family protein [Rhodanobacter]|uniref:beta-ketoacyl-[acyl-carrier-protein] synthase family protein n=1 Tax=Rhodanobacter TaxID=75309 RepID=UPI00042A0B0A|nr:MULTISPECIES: beta-ketoacyl-[acyl-carrier-protein] synthase family protein [Rhodanobacter]KZC20181.1 beta-ACP synthase [Rhodanobacter denitrificans]UJM94886.1 beta-ketoacyl-[acyl-carrier-protein] synthase family protein [Rhodanobacter denitrificans]UJM98416.1 beta-ketoacyl-[acyl-carrier-protein] synthase family protein [Rhodanobacter denitrificans]UJN22171.1 beta-ketoacyl-[acyl-carrier-protein] synthase family protein [Rhodanobacter denitrificans]
MPTVSTRRVVITGMGAISPLGVGAAALWQGLREGRSAIGPLRHPDAERLRVKVAAQVPESFDPAAHIDERTLPLLDRTSEFALHAAREAVAQSGVDFAGGLGLRTAVIVGTGVGGETTQDEQSRRLYAENAQRAHPLTIVRLMTNASASQISIAYGLHGPTYAVASACASANHAIIQAAQMIRYGMADAAVTGGTEACLTYGALRAWEAMRVVADDTCRPFSANRRGLVLGEGAGIFVLESLEHAQARGATILAELAGTGMSADASDIVMPSAEGAATAMRLALAEAELNPQDVDYINAHGTGTQANDVTETRAIRLAFGAYADRLAVSSTKSMHGHALGASGALELVAAIGALRENVVPPTANLNQVDPACDLDYVPNVAREMPVRAVLSNSFAFGGLNAVLALKRAS